MASLVRRVVTGVVVSVTVFLVVGAIVAGQVGVGVLTMLAGGLVLLLTRAVFSARNDADRWRDVPDDSGFERAETASEDEPGGAVFETSLADRSVTARLVGEPPGTGGHTVTLVEAPLRVARPGTGFVVEGPRDLPSVGELPDRAGRDLRALLDDADGSLVVDDRVGVVRYERPDATVDPETLSEAAEVVAAVADAVEERVEAAADDTEDDAEATEADAAGGTGTGTEAEAAVDER